MSQIERIARALCVSDGYDPESHFENARRLPREEVAWEHPVYIRYAKAVCTELGIEIDV